MRRPFPTPLGVHSSERRLAFVVELADVAMANGCLADRHAEWIYFAMKAAKTEFTFITKGEL